MAVKKSGKAASTDLKEAKWQGFVNVYLTPEEKKQIKQNPLSAEECLYFLGDMAQAGYKASFTWSIAGEFWSVSLTGKYQGRPNAGITMTLRHSDILIAITALQWCHDEAGKVGEWADRYTTAGGNDW